MGIKNSDEDSHTVARSGVFLREATGLVREANWADILIFASLNISWGLSAWWYFLWGPYFAPGGNLHLGILLVLVPMLFGALAWAFLVTIAPRSGGEYVFVSRILHPLLGFLSSFGWIIANFVWIAVLSAYVADPALSITFSLVGWSGAAEFVSSQVGIFVVGAAVIAVSAIVAILGFKAFRVFQAVCFTLGLTMFALVWFFLLTATRENFIVAWNSISSLYGSADYHTIVAESLNYIRSTYGIETEYSWDLAKAMPLMPVAAWGLIYPYLAAYIAGETRDVQKSMTLGLPGGLVLCALSWWITGALLERVVGYEFLLATAYAYGDGLELYTLPFPPSFHTFAGILAPTWARWLIGIGFVAWTFYYALYSIMPMSRIFLVWAFDRLAPEFLGDVSDRFHAPVKSIMLVSILGFAALAFYAWNPTYLASFTAMIPQISTTFMFTAISAIVVPFRARMKPVYEGAPVSKYKIGRLPFITVCGVIYAALLAALLYYYFTIEGLGALHIPSIMALLTAYLVGIIYFYAVKWYRRRQGIDIDVAFRELPPE